MDRYQEIKNYYQTLKDHVLFNLIENDLKDLESVAVNALIAEIRERKLNDKWIRAVEFAREPMSKEAFALFSRRVERQHCPICGQGEKPLSVSLVRRVTGQIFRVLREFKYVLACPSCIFEEREQAESYNKKKGWFAFPMGVFETLFTFFYHRKNRKIINTGKQTRDFYRYLHQAKAKIYYQFF